MPIRIRVVGESNAVLVLETDEPCHGIRARTVHADLAVVIHRHEREGRIDPWVYDRDVEFVDFVDRFPIMHGSAAKRVHAQLETRGADGIHVDDIPQITDVRQNKIFLACALRLHRRNEGHSLYAGVFLPQQLVGTVLDPLGHVGIRWTTVGWVILETTVLRRIMRGCDDDTVGKMLFSATVIDENSVRDNRRRGYSIVLLNDGFDIVGGQHLERGTLGGPGHRVGVLSHVERAVGALAAPVVADSLRDGQDMRLSERTVQWRATVPAGAKTHQLVRVSHVRPALVILPFELGQIDQHLFGGWLACEWRNRHGIYPLLAQFFLDHWPLFRSGTKCNCAKLSLIIIEEACLLDFGPMDFGPMFLGL